jgi:hypothetical protein
VGYEQLAKMQKGVTRALVNTALVMPAGFTRNADLAFPRGSMEREIEDAVAPGDAEFLDATRLATGLMGDSIATNLFMVGFAYQRGLLPVSEEALLRAIELNGTAIEPNKQSFTWGRRAAIDPAHVTAAAIPSAKPESQRLSDSLDEMIARRAEYLTAYQDAAYAARYTDFVAKVGEAEKAKVPGATTLTEAVARYYFKLLAVKDEYEVARLYAETDFAARVAAQFEGDYKLTFHLAPPVFNKPDAVTGETKKSVYGPWMMRAFGCARQAARSTGDAARHLRQDRRAPDGTRAPRPVRSARRRATGRAGAAQSCPRRSSSPEFPSTSADMGTSRIGTWWRRRRRRPSCWRPFARPGPSDRRRWRSPPTEAATRAPTQAAVLARFPSCGISQSVGGARSCVDGGRYSVRCVVLRSSAGRFAARRSSTSYGSQTKSSCSSIGSFRRTVYSAVAERSVRTGNAFGRGARHDERLEGHCRLLRAFAQVEGGEEVCHGPWPIRRTAWNARRLPS